MVFIELGKTTNSTKAQLIAFLGLGLGIIGFNYKDKIAQQIKNIVNKKQLEEYKKKIEKLSDEDQQNEFKKIIFSYSQQFEKSKVLEQIIEKQITEESQIGQLSKDFSYTSNDLNQEDLKQAICQPIWEMLSRGGKRVRPVFCALITEAFGYKFSDVMEIAGFIEVLHNCSLIIDDIQDDSLQRREKDAVHIMYGVDLSINAGNYGYYAPFNYLINVKKYSQKTIANLSHIYAYEMSHLHFGQGWDLFWHNNKNHKLKIPSEKQYLQMVVNKTGALFRMMVKMLGVVLNLNKENIRILSRFTENLGTVFQIQDDIINIDSQQYTTKGFRGEDIYEGKITLMVIHALNSQNEEKKQRLIEILCMKTTDQQIIDEAIGYIKEAGSIDYAKQLAHKFITEAWQELDKSLPESEAKYKLKLICQYIIKRQN